MSTETKTLPPSIVRKYEERVLRGAAMLDEKLPGWWRRIKLSRLQMAEGLFIPNHDDCGCIGAQLSAFYADIPSYNEEGCFSYAMDYLFGENVNMKTEVAFGFIAGAPEEDRGIEIETYDLLDVLWAEQIRIRRRASRARVS